MQPSDEKTKLDEIIKCPVCLDITRDPRRLACNHFFCKACIDRFEKSQCPNCNAKFERGREMTFPLLDHAIKQHSKGQCTLCKLNNQLLNPCEALNDETVCELCESRSTKYVKQGRCPRWEFCSTANCQQKHPTQICNCERNDCYQVHNGELEHNGIFPKF